MRPLKLTITAFGPYAKEEVIDFTQLKGRNLFVITGDTGAGKTTILDAIAYALYGKASGPDRDGENLRSHFAASDCMTKVEMEFELSGQRYWVQRIPKQLKKKSRGEGYTEQGVDAEFKSFDGKNVIISGMKQVNDKVVELMGISYEQFKQIIMIPQGEFRELLNADSNVRQDILQKIFGTEGFRRVQEMLYGQANFLSQEVSDLVNQRNQCIRSLDRTDHQALAALLELPNLNSILVIEETKLAISVDAVQASGLENQINEQEQKVADKQGEIFQGKANNLKLSTRDGAYERKITLEACQPQMEEKKIKLYQGRKALGLKGVEDYRYSRAVYVQKKKAELLKTDQQEKKARADVDISNNNYQLEMGKEDHRNQLLTEQARLQALTGKVADWDARQRANIELEKDLATVKKERDNTKTQLEKTREEIKEYQLLLDKARGAATAYTLKAVEAEKINTICTKLETLKEENDRLITLERSVFGLKQQEAMQFLEYEKARGDYESAQTLFLEGQAALLASTLKAGNCCPVCGSDHHPKVATQTGRIPSEDELKKLLQRDKQLRELYDKVKGDYESSKANQYAQCQIIARLQKELELTAPGNLSEVNTLELTQYIAERLPKYQIDRQKLNEEINKLAVQKKEETELAAALIKKTEAVSTLAAQLETLEIKYTQIFAEVQSAKDAMKGLEAEVPLEVRSANALAEALGTLKKELHIMKQALEHAEQQWRDNQVNHATAVAEKKAIEKALQEGEGEHKVSEQSFMAAMVDAGFKEETEFIKAKLTESQLTILETEISAYQAALRSAIDYYLQLQQDVEGLVPVDVSVLETEHTALQAGKSQLITQRTAIIARQVHNQTMLNSVCSLMEKLEQKEEEHLLIGHLARIARGDNEQKVSFERYVLAAFFNDIIDAANERLKKMTSGRYQMSRITQKGKGRGQSGLEIEVFDYYTGQSRHVKTLSGGESFKASLALALGLAEVVQSYAGGISLETMFVDEGFGTLDPESLDAAIGCLIELQHSGRLVGIISHVPELKSSVDARLEIEACKDGSRAKFCIL